MKAAKERAVRDNGGVPLEAGERWLLTTKACHDLLTERTNWHATRRAAKDELDNLKMIRRGRKTLPGDLVGGIMIETVSNRLLRDEETGLGGRDIRTELLKRQSKLQGVAKEVIAAKRLSSLSKMTGGKKGKKPAGEQDVPKFGYPAYAYFDEKDLLREERQQARSGRVPSLASTDEAGSVASAAGSAGSAFAGDVTGTRRGSVRVDSNESLGSVGSQAGAARAARVDSGESAGSVGSAGSSSSSSKAGGRRLSGLSLLKKEAKAVISREKRKRSRLRFVLPIGDDDGVEEMRWEKWYKPGSGNISIGGGDDDASLGSAGSGAHASHGASSAEGSELELDEHGRPTGNWRTKGIGAGESSGGSVGGGGSSVGTASNGAGSGTKKSSGSNVEETLSQTRAKIRMAEEMGYRPGLLRRTDDENPDPVGWMRTARTLRTVALHGVDPLEEVNWERDGRPALPDVAPLDAEVAAFLGVTRAGRPRSKEFSRMLAGAHANVAAVVAASAAAAAASSSTGGARQQQPGGGLGGSSSLGSSLATGAGRSLSIGGGGSSALTMGQLVESLLLSTEGPPPPEPTHAERAAAAANVAAAEAEAAAAAEDKNHEGFLLDSLGSVALAGLSKAKKAAAEEAAKRAKAEEAKRKADEEDEEGEEDEGGGGAGRGGFQGAFMWVPETVDEATTISLKTGKPGAFKPDGRCYHTLTVVPQAWSPTDKNKAMWLRPGMGLFLMFGGRKFVQAPPERRGDPSKGRYRPRPTAPTEELWSYTPDLAKWMDLTDYCKGSAPGPRSGHSCGAVRGSSGAVQLAVCGGLDARNNPTDDLFVLDLETLVWTVPMMRGIPPPLGTGSGALTELGRDFVITKDKEVAAPTKAERSAGVPAAMGVWRLRLVQEPPPPLDPFAELPKDAEQAAALTAAKWVGHWSRAPRMLPAHGSGHSVTTLGRSQVVFGGLMQLSRGGSPGEVVTMALGTVKHVGTVDGADRLLDGSGGLPGEEPGGGGNGEGEAGGEDSVFGQSSVATGVGSLGARGMGNAAFLHPEDNPEQLVREAVDRLAHGRGARALERQRRRAARAARRSGGVCGVVGIDSDSSSLSDDDGSLSLASMSLGRGGGSEATLKPLTLRLGQGLGGTASSSGHHHHGDDDGESGGGGGATSPQSEKFRQRPPDPAAAMLGNDGSGLASVGLGLGGVQDGLLARKPLRDGVAGLGGVGVADASATGVRKLLRGTERTMLKLRTRAEPPASAMAHVRLMSEEDLLVYGGAGWAEDEKEEEGGLGDRSAGAGGVATDHGGGAGAGGSRGGSGGAPFGAGVGLLPVGFAGSLVSSVTAGSAASFASVASGTSGSVGSSASGGQGGSKGAQPGNGTGYGAGTGTGYGAVGAEGGGSEPPGGVLLLSTRPLPSEAQRRKAAAAAVGPGGGGAEGKDDAFDNPSAGVLVLGGGSRPGSRPGSRQGAEERPSGLTLDGRPVGGPFGAGSRWEPAGWLRPWIKAGIRRVRDPPPRQYHAATHVSRRHLMVTGGELGGANLDPSHDGEVYRVAADAFLLDLKTSEWCQLPVSNPMRRAGHALALVDGKLFSFGGRTAPLPATKPFPSELHCLHYDG